MKGLGATSVPDRGAWIAGAGAGRFDQAASTVGLRRRTAAPTMPKPAIIIAQVAGSGMALVGEKVAKV